MAGLMNIVALRLARLSSPPQGYRLHSAPYVIFPPTIVATTFPVNCQPSKGVLCDIDRDFAASNVQRFLTSKMVTSAQLPHVSDPRARRLKTRAGPAGKGSTRPGSRTLRSRRR